MRTTEGWVLVGPGQLELDETRELPEPKADEVLLEVEQVGGCQSELDRYLGLAPAKPRAAIGHEIAGRVLEVGSAVSTLKVGDRVAVQADGGYARQLVVPAWWCVPVPQGMAYPALIEPTGCLVGAVERVTAFRNLLGQADRTTSDVVVIIGATGQMGLMLQRIVALQGPRMLIVTGRRDEALARAAQLGAVTVNTNRESLADTVKKLTDGHGADFVYDVASKPDSVDLAVEVARDGGVVGVVGFAQGKVTYDEGETIGKRVDRVSCHFRKTPLVPAMRRAVALFASGAIDEHELVSDVLGFDDIPNGFELAARRPAGYTRWVADMTLDE